MHARLTTIEVSADKIDEAVAMMNEQVIPPLKALDGFVGAYFLAGLGAGKLVGITLWDSEASLKASEEAGAKLRADTAEEAGGTVVSVERFEVIAQV
jgi:heme-degrading monooxygenase HmoA